MMFVSSAIWSEVAHGFVNFLKTWITRTDQHFWARRLTGFCRIYKDFEAGFSEPDWIEPV
jgi:hypothetical protein